MPPGTSNDTTLENPTFLHALKSWCKERKTYPLRLQVKLANTLRAGMSIHVEAQPQKNSIPMTEDEQLPLSRYVLIDETLTESTAARLTIALQAIHDQQGLVFRQGLCYMTSLYLVLYDLERTQAGNTSLRFTNRDAQREEHGQEVPPLWALEEVLRFWERCDGRLNRGFPPPRKRDKGRWCYSTMPPLWLPSTEVPEVKSTRSRHKDRGSWDARRMQRACVPSSVPIMVPDNWKTWVENLVALLQGLAPHGVHINISVGTAAPKPLALSMAEANLFRQKGEGWDIVYQGHGFFLKHIKGLSYIAYLLRHPTEKFTPLQLSRGIGESVPAKGDRVYSSMSETRLEDQALGVSTWDGTTTDIEQMVDKQTVEQCRQKLADLTEQKEEAERYHDYERVTHLEAEMDAIIAYLTNNTHSGTIKTFPTSADKIRTSVTKRIRDAIGKIDKQDSTLARQLNNCIRTGNQCSYNPDPQNPITWSFLS